MENGYNMHWEASKPEPEPESEPYLYLCVRDEVGVGGYLKKNE